MESRNKNAAVKRGLVHRKSGTVKPRTVAFLQGVRTGRDGAEVASALPGRWHVAGPGDTFNALVPLLGPEEKDLVLLDRPADGVTVIVPAELVLCARGATCLEDGVVGVQLVVAAGIVSAAVEIVLT